MADEATGSIQPARFYQEFVGVGYLTRDELEQAWQQIDTDGSGDIDVTEFIELCTDVAILHPGIHSNELLIRSLHYVLEQLEVDQKDVTPGISSAFAKAGLSTSELQVIHDDHSSGRGTVPDLGIVDEELSDTEASYSSSAKLLIEESLASKRASITKQMVKQISEPIGEMVEKIEEKSQVVVLEQLSELREAVARLEMIILSQATRGSVDRTDREITPALFDHDKPDDDGDDDSAPEPVDADVRVDGIADVAAALRDSPTGSDEF
jgi:hypothetical protein